MRELLDAAAQRAMADLGGLGARSVAPSPKAVAQLALLNTPLIEQPGRAELTLQRLDQVDSAATITTAGPRFFGFVIGDMLPVALADVPE